MRTEWYIEDLSQMIKIDTSQCAFQDSFFLDGHIVICTGVLDQDRTFHVARMRHPCSVSHLQDSERSISLGLQQPSYSIAEKSRLSGLKERFRVILESTGGSGSAGVGSTLLRQSWVVVNGCKFDNEKVYKRLEVLFNSTYPLSEALYTSFFSI